ncbi:hypothetical protein [uncultured Methanobrevibacter sp.]|uniref:hypothetical protein n=1 Tax=uncultured Methanobrevibacter sp. TaxID=253161 RepID=UPI0025E91A70|nr:hypothetical protein [uncultured Methanobrevibacter sp.]
MNKINVISISKLENITFDSVESFISWFGNDGVLSNCTFAGNSAVNGSAVTWIGNKGLIDHCIFILQNRIEISILFNFFIRFQILLCSL